MVRWWLNKEEWSGVIMEWKPGRSGGVCVCVDLANSGS